LLTPAGPGRLRRLRDALDGLSRLDHHLAVGRNKRPQLRPFFGWSRNSNMPGLYARTYFEAQIAKVWRDDFDARVDFLRRIP
jgi:hypothetical protein